MIETKIIPPDRTRMMNPSDLSHLCLSKIEQQVCGTPKNDNCRLLGTAKKIEQHMQMENGHVPKISFSLAQLLKNMVISPLL